MFSELIKKSFAQYLNDIVTDRLQTALEAESEKQKSEKILEDLEKQSPPPANTKVNPKIVTTQEELDAFRIIPSDWMFKN
ncbi:MAG: hypothetical protein LBQ77_00870 [Treponema sp.]|jgi:hypothetical protein|nr:hypothetical protein [Treponema sp.]